MMRGISSLSFSGPLRKKIEAAASSGFDGIEIFREDLVYWDGALSEVARFAADSGIAILSLQSLRDFEALPDDDRAWTLKRARRFLDLAVEIGAPLLIVCANTRSNTLDNPDVAAADLAMLADMAAERGLRVGYEALSTSRTVRTYLEAWRIIEKADRPNLGLVLGAVHTFATGADFAALKSIDPERIFLVHLADAPTLKMDVRLLSRHFRLFPGQGDLPIAELFDALRERGYDGPVSMEIFNDQVRALPARRIADDGIRAFRLLEEITGARATPRPMVQDIGFIEFACQRNDAADFKRLLKAMGFAHTHRHKSKNIALYRQGGIHLVLNEEKDSFAHSFYLLHGLSVCGLAFHIDNLPAMRERIALFRGREFEQLAMPDELHIPAIRGLGGSMIFCLDGSAGAPDFYDVDFEQIADQPNAEGAGLLSVDYLSQAVPPIEFLSSLLFYRALFGFEADEQIDIMDPHGTVRSRTLSNGNGRIRMSLNASIGPSTMTQRFLSKNIFAAYEHLAFGCADIFAYARTLDQELVLHMPANYYFDLSLRFDLEPQLIEEMRAHNILYDEDADGGAYFQIFTRDINGLFLEVVQRNGYAGFGAANAPVRMAAQARDYEQLQNFIAEVQSR
jgi:4-hydroxyphenylpyruvate dioxygenase